MLYYVESQLVFYQFNSVFESFCRASCIFIHVRYRRTSWTHFDLNSLILCVLERFVICVGLEYFRQIYTVIFRALDKHETTVFLVKRISTVKWFATWSQKAVAKRRLSHPRTVGEFFFTRAQWNSFCDSQMDKQVTLIWYIVSSTAFARHIPGGRTSIHLLIKTPFHYHGNSSPRVGTTP